MRFGTGLFGLLFSMMLLFNTVWAQDSEERVTVKTMVGQVEIRSQQSTTWRPARIGMALRMGWDIRTYVESKAELEFGSGTVLKISENTVLTLSKIMTNGAQQTSNTGVKVATGQLWANVKKLSSTKSTFDFETPTAVASIRGTRLGIAVAKDGSTIDVYEGNVAVRNKGSNRTVMVSTRVSAVVKQGVDNIETRQMTEKDVQKEKTVGDTATIVAPKDTAKVAKPDSSKPAVDTTKAKGADSTALAKPDTTKPAVRPDSTKQSMLKPDSIAAAAKLKTPTRALTLMLTAPQDRITIAKTQIDVAGTTVPGAEVRVNGTNATVTASGSFLYSIPIPDEATDYVVEVVAEFNNQQQTIRRTVSYKPIRIPMSLIISSPAERAVIKERSVRIAGTTNPRATVTVNGRTATVSPSGAISAEIQLTERNIPELQIDITASDGETDLSKTITVSVDLTSPQINTSAPMLNVSGNEQSASKTGRLSASVTDATPEDEVVLTFVNNGSSQDFTLTSGARENVTLDPGKNNYSLSARDKAGNRSAVVSGEIYYLPGPLTININTPESNPYTVTDLPPLPRNVKPTIEVEVEVDDKINSVPTTIKYCRIAGGGQTITLRDNKNYSFTGTLSLVRGINTFTITTEDMAQNVATKTLTVNLR